MANGLVIHDKVVGTLKYGANVTACAKALADFYSKNPQKLKELTLLADGSQDPSVTLRCAFLAAICSEAGIT